MQFINAYTWHLERWYDNRKCKKAKETTDIKTQNLGLWERRRGWAILENRIETYILPYKADDQCNFDE